ncbi:MAG: hypothetical protein ACYCYE_07720 [Clostridia bacterium]
MKIFRFILIIAMAIAISCFSWGYYTSKSLQEKHERAILVMGECCNTMKIPDLERLLCI